MRSLLPLLVLLAVARAAPENLLPREGSGWEGFKAASWAKLKTTFAPEGRVPAVTITVETVTKVGEKELTLKADVTEAVGLERTSERKVPRSGEAATNEKTAPAENLPDEEVTACGKVFSCTVARTTITGPDGKRVVTEWRAKDPLLRVKRLEKTYDAKGESTSTYTMLLTGLGEKRTIGKRSVACLRYRTLRRAGTQESEGEALVSSAVPGGTVTFDEKHTRDGKVLLQIRIECLDFEAK